MTPARITFRNMDSSPAVEHEVQTRAEKLSSHFTDLLDCHVVIEMPHRRHRQGAHFRVLIELSVPGKNLVVSRDPSDDGAREDAHVVIHEAFRAAHRELEHWVEQRRNVRRAGT